MDPFEEKGREFWKVSHDLPRASKFLGKFNHRESVSWAFYLLRQGSPKDVIARGVRGVHYAIDYRELGQMVQEYGIIVAHWPSLPPANENPGDEDGSVDTTQENVDNFSVDIDESPSTVARAGSSSSSARNNWTPQNATTSRATPMTTMQTAGQAVVSPPGDIQIPSDARRSAMLDRTVVQEKKSPMDRMKIMETEIRGEASWEEKRDWGISKILISIETFALDRQDRDAILREGYGIETRLKRLEKVLHMK